MDDPGAPPPAPVTAARGFRYMTDYACTGAECPETCCGSWGIPVDERTHQRLHELMQEPDERARLRRLLIPELASARSPQRVATIELTEAGACPFHDQDRLCELQRRFGSSSLPTGCATYPRVVSRVAARLELTGALSCPEIARIALLSAGALDRIPFPIEQVATIAPSQGLRGGADPAARLDLVRETLHLLVTGADRPLDTRLFRLAWIGDQLDQVVAERCAPARLAHTINRFTAPESLDDADRQLAAAPDDDGFGLGCVVELLRAIDPGKARRFPELTAEVLGSFSEGPTWPAFVARRDALPPARRARVDQLVARMAAHTVLTEWYTFSPRLRIYTMMVLLRAATVRFLLLGHPRATVLTDAEFDALAVDVVASFARAIDRNRNALTSQFGLVDRALPTFAHAALLLQLAGHHRAGPAPASGTP